MTTQTTGTQPKPDPDVWLASGDVIIACESTLFCVHATVLSRNSTVLSELCSGVKTSGASQLSQPAILHVCDTAYDMKQLLYALYDGLSFLKPAEAASFPVLAALARMAHKYKLEQLLSEITRRLKTVFTDSFNVWRMHYGGGTELAAVEPHHAIEALNLFRLIGRMDMLPAAFYMCTQLDLETLLRGVLRANGSTLEVLEADDLERCLNAQYELKERQVQIGQDMSLRSADCRKTTKEHCQRQLLEFQRFMYDKYYLVASSDPLGNDLLRRFSAVEGICDHCFSVRTKWLRVEQTTLWKMLPALAGLEETHTFHHAPRAELNTLVDSSVPQFAPGLSNDADIWCEDGNVVFIAESTAFRVHKSQLSRHSDVFSGLFTVPQPTTGHTPPSSISDLSDGCAIVHVPDAAYDFKHLLLALYDGARHLKPAEAAPFSMLSALARMAHKYEVDWLLAEATRRLKTAFPDQFIMWQEDMSTSSVTVVPSDAIEALNLFQRIDRLEMLPAALYACCQLDIGTLIRGVARADRMFIEKLSIDDLERVLKARRALTTRNVELALTLFSGPPSPTCPPETACAAVQGDCHGCDMVEHYIGADANILGPSFLHLIEDYLEDDPVFCEGCAQMLKDKERAARQAAWRSLPGYAGVHLESWGPEHTAKAVP